MQTRFANCFPKNSAKENTLRWIRFVRLRRFVRFTRSYTAGGILVQNNKKLSFILIFLMQPNKNIILILKKKKNNVWTYLKNKLNRQINKIIVERKK